MIISKKIVHPISNPNHQLFRCLSPSCPQKLRNAHPFFQNEDLAKYPTKRKETVHMLLLLLQRSASSASEIKAWGLVTGDAWDTDTVSNGRNQGCIEVGLFLPKPLGYCWRWSMVKTPLSRQSQFSSGTPEPNEKTHGFQISGKKVANLILFDAVVLESGSVDTRKEGQNCSDWLTTGEQEGCCVQKELNDFFVRCSAQRQWLTASRGEAQDSRIFGGKTIVLSQSGCYENVGTTFHFIATEFTKHKFDLTWLLLVYSSHPDTWVVSFWNLARHCMMFIPKWIAVLENKLEMRISVWHQFMFMSAKIQSCPPPCCLLGCLVLGFPCPYLLKNEMEALPNLVWRTFKAVGFNCLHRKQSALCHSFRSARSAVLWKPRAKRCFTGMYLLKTGHFPGIFATLYSNRSKRPS